MVVFVVACVISAADVKSINNIFLVLNLESKRNIFLFKTPKKIE